MDREIPVALPAGDPSEQFFLHLNALLSTRQRSTQGTVNFLPEGAYVAVCSGVFNIADADRTVEWRLTTSIAGDVRSLAVSCPDADAAVVFAYAEELVRVALANALSNKRELFVQRRVASYVGTALSGEYWLRSLRVAPAVMEHTDALYRMDFERVVFLDFAVSAIDRNQAFALAQKLEATYLQRLSLLLDINIEPIPHEWLWVIPSPDGNPDVTSERRHRGYYHPSRQIDALPRKGELCPLARFEGSVASMFRNREAGALLHLPEESRALFRLAQRAPHSDALALDACARMYRLSMVLARHSQSASLAYRVAAIDAIVSATKPRFRSVSDFIRNYCPELQVDDAVLDFLYEDVRSAHFHAGAAPADDHSLVPHHPLMSLSYVRPSSLSFAGYLLTHRAIGGWLKEVANAHSPVEEDA